MGIPGDGDDGVGHESSPRNHRSTLAKIHADPIEVTNAKWNEVATWGRNNGYTNLLDAPANDDNS